MNYIYIIHDPSQISQTCYIGVTRESLKYRLNKHLAEKSNRTHKQRWLKSLLERNIKPEIIEIESFENDDERAEREIFWISYYRSIGMKLCNGTDGGDGIVGLSREAQEKKRLALIGNDNALGSTHTEEWKQENSERMIGNKYAEGREQTEEEKQVRSESMKKAWQEQDWSERNAKVSTSMMGNTNGRFTKGIKKGPMSEENKLKISAANKGKLKKPEIDNEKIIALYKQGIGITAIGRELHIDKMTAKKRLISAGIL